MKEDEISEEVETREYFVDIVGEKGNITPRKLPRMRRKMFKVRKEEQICRKAFSDISISKYNTKLIHPECKQ